MSSSDDFGNTSVREGSKLQVGSKKRRLQRACDICRRKKIRCDSAQMPGNRCSNCIVFNSDCTHSKTIKKRGPQREYVEGLEQRIKKMENILQKLCPDVDLAQMLGSQSDTEGSPPDKTIDMTVLSTTANEPFSSIPIPARGYPTLLLGAGRALTNAIPSQDDDLTHIALAEHLGRLSINTTQDRFFGKSSGFMLIQTAMNIKKEYTGNENSLGGKDFKRPEFWNVHPWERLTAEQETPYYVYPDEDLIVTLTTIYFVRVHPFFPLLHRPTFEKSVAEGLHLRNHLFGATLLAVCSVASRYSNDPRVFLEDVNCQHSCGWKWFDQIQIIRKSLLDTPSLYELQFYCLSIVYLQGSSTPQACWAVLGLAVRFAQERGVHRRKRRDHKLTVEDELWKRAFWVLFSMDRIISSFLGRPCAIQDEDFDIDLPIECDDEYWEHPDPNQAFKQPLGRPSILAYFNSHLKLCEILSFTLRTLYSTNKSKVFLGLVGPQWEREVVAELDSALNNWIDSVPDHLRWDPNREDRIFFDQSALLYVTYYHLQIQIHRPFIPSPHKPSDLSFPSLAICTNAARCCSHVLDLQARKGVVPLPHMQMAAFTAAIVLLLNIWGGRRSGLSTDQKKEMADVHKCMQVLQICEPRWQTAGRLWDLLYELASIGELPLLKQTMPSNKRERDADSPALSGETSESPWSVIAEAPRIIAGSRRVSPSNTTGSAAMDCQEDVSEQNPFPIFMYDEPRDAGSARGDFHSPDDLDYNHPPSTGAMDSGVIGAVNNFSLGELFADQRIANTLGAVREAYDVDDKHQLAQSTQEATNVDWLQVISSPLRPPSNVMMDSDIMAMWSNVPTGFNLEAWGTYIANVSEFANNLDQDAASRRKH